MVLLEVDAADVQECLHELGWADGLPVVEPTPERVQAMVAEFGRSLGPAAPPAVSVPHPISSRATPYLEAVAGDQLRLALVGRPEPVDAL